MTRRTTHRSNIKLGKYVPRPVDVPPWMTAERCQELETAVARGEDLRVKHAATRREIAAIRRRMEAAL